MLLPPTTSINICRLHQPTSRKSEEKMRSINATSRVPFVVSLTLIFGSGTHQFEHRFGHVAFAGFYLVSGIVATIAQIALDPSSAVPNLGASGAISGVMGAYLVLFPRNRVHAIFFFNVVRIPAMLALGVWIVLQLFSGFGTLGAEQTGGVAYGAHIGGFMAGVVMALILRRAIPERDNDVRVRSRAADPRTRRLW